MDRDLTDRRILITGASSGIGRCLAEQAAQKRARVALAARSADKLEELASKLTAQGGSVFAIPADVTCEEDRCRLLETVAQQWGGLDILVNNAGVASFGHFVDSTEEILRQIMEVNFFAPAELIRKAIPMLVQGNEPAIVNVASMCGRRGLPAWPEYSASKFALCGLTEALRGEMARFDIDTLLILPGLTQSDLPRRLLRNSGRMRIDFEGGMAPDSVAAGILRAICTNRTETVLGREARWMLRVNRFLPGLVDRLIDRRVRRLYAGRDGECAG
jgi:short-subunit dehydrogenase